MQSESSVTATSADESWRPHENPCLAIGGAPTQRNAIAQERTHTKTHENTQTHKYTSTKHRLASGPKIPTSKLTGHSRELGPFVSGPQ